MERLLDPRAEERRSLRYARVERPARRDGMEGGTRCVVLEVAGDVKDDVDGVAGHAEIPGAIHRR